MILALNLQIINGCAGTEPGLPTAGTAPGRLYFGLGIVCGYDKEPLSLWKYGQAGHPIVCNEVLDCMHCQSLANNAISDINCIIWRRRPPMRLVVAVAILASAIGCLY